MDLIQKLLMTSSLCVLFALSAHCWKLDCTKFVFAPKCRGIAAKRASQPNNDMQNLPVEFLRELAAMQQSADNEDSQSRAYQLQLLLSDPHNEQLGKYPAAEWGDDAGAEDWDPGMQDYGLPSSSQYRRLRSYFDALAVGQYLPRDKITLKLQPS